jgi:hypothetical protein
MHQSLKNLNMIAMYCIAFFVLPIGNICVIIAASLVEAPGIALFFADMFLGKASEFFVRLGVPSAKLWAGIIAYGIGVFYAFLQAIGNFVLVMNGYKRASKFLSGLFLTIGVFSYFNMLKMTSLDGSFNLLLALSVIVFMAVPVTLISFLSNNLAAKLLNMPFYKDIIDSMYKSAAAIKAVARGDLPKAPTLSNFQTLN